MALKLEGYLEDATGCCRCSNCKFIEYVWMDSARFARQCPINAIEKYNLYSAPGLMASALGVLKKELEFSPRLLDALYKCTLCGACDIRCKRNLDLEIGSVIETLKAKAVEDGAGPLPQHKLIAEKIENNHNYFGSPQANRTKWITEDIKVANKADILYFVGCKSSYVNQDIAQSTARILNKTNTEFMVSSNEWCCGYPLYSTGQVDAFMKQVKHNMEVIKESGAKLVLLSCAEGYKTLKVDYPKQLDMSTEDMDFKVMHVVEYIDELIKSEKINFKKNINMKIAYHDPCNLGRLSDPWYHWDGVHKQYGILEPPKTWRRGEQGVYEQPRNILANIPGIEIVEMERKKDNSWCCGAGAGVKESFEDFALKVASERIDEAKSTGAEAIVSACPSCKEILKEAINKCGEKLEVYDITEIILRALV